MRPESHLTPTDDIKPPGEGMLDPQGALSGLKAFIDQGKLDYVCFMDEGDYFDDAYLSRFILRMHGVDTCKEFIAMRIITSPLTVSRVYPFLNQGFQKPCCYRSITCSHAFFHKGSGQAVAMIFQ